MRTVTILGLIILVLFTSAAWAGDYYVDIVNGSNSTGDGSQAQPWRTITYALLQISGTGHTLHVAPGTYDNTPGPDGSYEIFPFTLGVNMSLIGSGSASTILDAKGTNRVLTVNNSTGNPAIEGFTITNGTLVDGAGAYINNSTVTLSDVTFLTNKADKNGGGLLVTNSHVNIYDALITQNQTLNNAPSFPGGGGGIHLSGSSLTTRHVTIESNSGRSGGGGILMQNSVLTCLDQLVVRGNSYIHYGGGGILAVWSSFNLTDGILFESNTGGNDYGGGGLRIVYSDVTLSNLIFNNNYSSILAGAAHIQESSVTITDSLFKNNEAPGGGAILADGSAGNLKIERCIFTGNTGTSVGGAIELTSGNSLYLADSIIRDNTCGRIATGYGIGGAAAYVYNINSATILNNTITNNKLFRGTSDLKGGVIGLAKCNRSCLIEGNVIQNCSTEETNGGDVTGSIYVDCIGDSLIIRDNFVHHNRLTTNNNLASKLCAGIWADGSVGYSEVSGNIIVSNDYDGLGEAPGSIVENNIIAGNGRYGIKGTPARVTNNSICNNGKDGLFLWYGGPCLFTNNIVMNNAGIGLYENGVNYDIIAKYNLFYNNPGGIFKDENNPTPYTDLLTLETFVPEVKHNLDADPLIADPANNNYHLLAGSPCINAGTTTNAPSTDFDGEPRPAGGGYDIGADEHYGAHWADTNFNYVIENFEMLHVVDDWAASVRNQGELDEARSLWRCLDGYRSNGAGGYLCR